MDTPPTRVGGRLDNPNPLFNSNLNIYIQKYFLDPLEIVGTLAKILFEPGEVGISIVIFYGRFFTQICNINRKTIQEEQHTVLLLGKRIHHQQQQQALKYNMENTDTKIPSISKLQELKEGLSKIKVLEAELAGSKWNDDPSPKSVEDFQNSLLTRYEKAKSMYMKRRLESFMVDNVSEFDESTNQFDIPDVPSMAAASGDSGDSEDQAIDAKHAKALAALETAAQGVHVTLSKMRDSYQTVISRRKELEQMVQDLEHNDASAEDGDHRMEIVDGEDADIDAERERTERLQQRKRQLEEECARLVKQKEERMKSISNHRDELALLQEEESKIRKEGKDPSEFLAKIKELKEMKEFYDSLRQVMEELGGVKILNAKEDNESRHLFLTLAIYEKHQVEVELEVYRKTLLKLVSAKWLSTPVVTSVPISLSDGDTNQEQFSLPIDPLDDLVQTAKTSMGPPHDLRFIVREACARIRILQNRVDDIAVLRLRVLTKVVGNDQVVCSLNEGIVIVMRLYDQWVKVEQIVGVSGWDQSATDKIHDIVSKREESWTPSKVVDLVQKEMERLKTQDGVVLPKTPTLPIRRIGKPNEK